VIQEEIANKITKLIRRGAPILFISPHLLSDLIVIDLSEFLCRCQPKYGKMPEADASLPVGRGVFHQPANKKLILMLD
jgi:hypothetical protein